jgi:hypothetical protein
VTEWAMTRRDEWFFAVSKRSVPSILAERLLEHAVGQIRDNLDALLAISAADAVLCAEARKGKKDFNLFKVVDAEFNLIDFAELAKLLQNDDLDAIIYDEDLGDEEKAAKILDAITQPDFQPYC